MVSTPAHSGLTLAGSVDAAIAHAQLSGVASYCPKIDIYRAINHSADKHTHPMLTALTGNKGCRPSRLAPRFVCLPPARPLID